MLLLGWTDTIKEGSDMVKKITGFYRSISKSESEPSENMDSSAASMNRGSNQTTHSHQNLAVLNQLGIDQYGLLSLSNSPINPPLIKNEW